MLTSFAGTYASIIVIGSNPEKKWYRALYEFAKKNPNCINIICCSSQLFGHTQEDFKREILKQKSLDLFELNNLVFFSSSGNTMVED